MTDSMTPEQRAAALVAKHGWQLDATEWADLIAALKPSAAVRELLRAADELRTIMHLDGTTKTPRYDKAAAAVRQELGL